MSTKEKDNTAERELKSSDKKTSKKSMLPRILLSILIIICVLVAVIIVGARIYFRSPAEDYYAHSKKAFKIPEINNGFIPQGLAYNEADGYFLTTGYMKDGSASPIYIIDGDGNLISKATICDESGNAFPCHAGGISIYKDYVYVAGCQDCALYVYSYEDIKNGGNINLLGTFSTKINDNDYLNIDCTTICDGKIILGEFFREENYQTLPSHKITTAGGDYNQAIALVYELGDYADTYGISPTPIAAYSIGDKVQGMAIHNGMFYTSSSYATASSSIDAFALDSANVSSISILDQEDIPLVELDSSCKAASFVLPPMSEEIEFVDDRFYTMCESASDKYIFGKLISHTYCYSTELY